MDDVYCEDFPFRGRDSIFQHAAPSIALLAEHRVVVLPRVPLLEVLEAEVRAEEARGAVLQRDAALALDGRRPHPLVRRAVREVDDEQRDALHLGGLDEGEHRLAAAVGAQAVVDPALVRDLALRVDHLQQALVVLRVRLRALLRLLHDLAGVLGGGGQRGQGKTRRAAQIGRGMGHGTWGSGLHLHGCSFRARDSEPGGAGFPSANRNPCRIRPDVSCRIKQPDGVCRPDPIPRRLASSIWVSSSA